MSTALYAHEHGFDCFTTTNATSRWKDQRQMDQCADQGLAGEFRSGQEPPQQDATCRSRNHPWPIFAHPKGKEFVDFDEDLQIRDITDAAAEGYDDIELLKRYSTVGMGPSQGRHSALASIRLAVIVATAPGLRRMPPPEPAAPEALLPAIRVPKIVSVPAVSLPSAAVSA